MLSEVVGEVREGLEGTLRLLEEALGLNAPLDEAAEIQRENI
jgi:hypothetical protein